MKIAMLLILVSCVSASAQPSQGRLGQQVMQNSIVSTEFVINSNFSGNNSGADVTGWLGLIFTANTNFTITDIGSWVWAGNTHTHSNAILNSSCAVLGSVVVDHNGATTNAYLYGHLSTPITISNGASYSVMISLINGEDRYYNGAALTTTTVGSITSQSLLSCIPIGSAGNAYGPVSFKYTIP